MTAFVRTDQAFLGRRNPVVKIAAGLVVAIAALAARDPVTPSLLLIGPLVALPLSGLSPATLARRGTAVLAGAVSVGLATAFFGNPGGWTIGGALALRVVAIALPGVLMLSTTDPTDLADSLVQQLRAPARFAYGSLAALRLLPLLTTEWRTIGLARRARGVSSGGNPVVAARLLFGRVFTLLVGAIRRASRIAAAMDSRGFDSRLPRTYARQQTVQTADVFLLLAAVLLAVTATAVSVVLGSWQPLVS
jgi:energy-coupling factor transport system permease protein